MAPDFQRITFSDFVGYDKHFLLLEINEDLDAIVVDHSLPELPAMFPTHGTIEKQLKTFCNYLEQMQDFYYNMNTFDRVCFALDVNVSTKSLSRTIKIGKILNLLRR